MQNTAATVLFTLRSQRARNIATREQLVGSSQIQPPNSLYLSRALQGSPVPGPSKQLLDGRNVAHLMSHDISSNSDQDEDFSTAIATLNLEPRSGI